MKTHELSLGKSVWNCDIARMPLSPESPWSAPPCTRDSTELESEFHSLYGSNKNPFDTAVISESASCLHDGYMSEPDLEAISEVVSHHHDKPVGAMLFPQLSTSVQALDVIININAAILHNENMLVRVPWASNLCATGDLSFFCIHADVFYRACHVYQPQTPTLQPLVPFVMDAFENREERIAHIKSLYNNECCYRTFSVFALQAEKDDITPCMRCVLLDWTMDVAAEYKMQHHTLYLAVNYLDRFLYYDNTESDKHRTLVGKSNLQLLGASCLFIASKLEEVTPISLDEITDTAAGAYKSSDIKRMELCVLTKLHWQLHAPTVSSWWPVYITELVHTLLHSVHNDHSHTFSATSELSTRLNEGETDSVRLLVHDVQQLISSRTYFRAMRILDMAMLSTEFACFHPSHLAASVLFILFAPKANYAQRIQTATGYTFEDLQTCIQFLENVQKRDMLTAHISLIHLRVASTVMKNKTYTLSHNSIQDSTYVKQVQYIDNTTRSSASPTTTIAFSFHTAPHEKVPSALLRNGHSQQTTRNQLAGTCTQ